MQGAASLLKKGGGDILKSLLNLSFRTQMTRVNAGTKDISTQTLFLITDSTLAAGQQQHSGTRHRI